MFAVCDGGFVNLANSIMEAEQLCLDMPISYEVGQAVWWTSGLTHMCHTYKTNGKIRPEHQEKVVILEIIINPPTSYRSYEDYTYVIQTDDRQIHTCARWLSPNVSPCEAVLEAYSRWGN